MIKNRQLVTLCIALVTWVAPVMAFDSGSTGADGSFSPITDTSLALPANGIFNFTNLNIPIGVTVDFTPNQLNTPAIILVSGNTVINGTISLNGVDGDNLGPTFVTIPPGGFAGGQGVLPNSPGGNGLGPGAGHGGTMNGCGGTGAGYANNTSIAHSICSAVPTGLAYGSPTLQPLIGGSGGGAGGNASTVEISGTGGSGAGALLLAVSGTLTLNGSIVANGGAGESVTSGGGGGGGSGGAVRLVATEFTGLGSVSVLGGLRGNASSSIFVGPAGSFGRIRTEFEASTFSGTLIPGAASTIAMPSSPFFANVPTITITSIAGQSVPQFPSGDNDVILPSDTLNPVTIEIATTQVNVGETVKITVSPKIGTVLTVDSTPLVGLIENASASADINLALGASVITASVSFSVTTAQSEILSQFTNDEPVKQIALATTLGKGSTMTLLTASGKSYVWPQNAALLMN